MSNERTYHLLYKIGYRNNPMWKCDRFKVKASSLKAAKAKVRRTHPKATKLEFQSVIK